MKSLTTFAATALVIFAIGQALAQPARSAELRTGRGNCWAGEVAMPSQPTKESSSRKRGSAFVPCGVGADWRIRRDGAVE